MMNAQIEKAGKRAASHERAARVLERMSKKQLLTLGAAGGLDLDHYKSLTKGASIDAVMCLLTRGNPCHAQRFKHTNPRWVKKHRDRTYNGPHSLLPRD